LHVFDIGGNKYRLVVFLHFVQQIAYVKHVLTHAEYDRMAWRSR
jgi:mRNA interferase HigB